MSRVAVGADHAGYHYKQLLAEHLRQGGHEVVDLGTDGPQSVDYPDYARAVAEAVVRGEAERGLLVCGSAVGVCMVANKVRGVRAGVCHETYSARQAVEHDDMNVLCLGERVIGIEVAREVTDAFMAARFSDEGRHRRRLDKLLAVEDDYMSNRAEN
ncbi:MAG: ribose 5-phosphate isomerase B [Gemmatimonadetes bacterium]|nr:ribose 5-phosphate isomerase B [Gemmatimonadota bacterium]MBT8479921.1 ribose 5-phosphate isomerase B [Gemmatimonadota bacterium]